MGTIKFVFIPKGLEEVDEIKVKEVKVMIAKYLVEIAINKLDRSL